MKLNSKSGSAGVPPGTVAKSGNGLYVVAVLMPAPLQGFAQWENGYVY
ncbi:MAG: hypothetical protein WAX30_18695 [Citrobacter portucalensis]|nr:MULTISPECIES: hypothetical protein [Citrobacter]MBA8560265.1 hypothetical protein [Citrobacter freundii]MBD0804999.1 hypothetical protein [Citrobacter sp. C13]MBN4858549.1 hypothetical protein [Citrobacter freundii]MCR3697341.1 hypothetical protein [Citrobacter portucalensis]MDM2901685.1 hypothetical protein [Citrobacter sp. Cpo037]